MKKSSEWRSNAENTLLDLFAELRKRGPEMKTIELIGAIRTVAEALTTDKALLPKPEESTKP